MPNETQQIHRMRGLDVRYISLCGEGKNGRSIIAKGELADGQVVIEKAVAIRKSDAAKRMVYGVVYAPESVDADGHVADAAEIEKAMHGFMRNARVGQVDTNHDEQVGVGYVAESWLVKADEDGVVVDALFPEEPAGTWAVGIKVAADASWEKVEKGELGGLSLAGVATLEAEAIAKSEASEAESVAKSFVAKVKSLLGIVDDEPEATAVAEMAGVDKARGFPVDHYIPTPNRSDGGDVQTQALTRLLAQMIVGSAGAGALEPATTTSPLGVSPTMLAKGFQERMLRSQMWRVSEALSDGIRDVLDDDDVTDKAAGIRAVVAEFEAWLTVQMAPNGNGGAASVAMAKTSDGDAGGDGTVGGDGAAVSVVSPALVARIEALEKSTAGRQSVLGGADVRVEKEQKKGLRIV